MNRLSIVRRLLHALLVCALALPGSGRAQVLDSAAGQAPDSAVVPALRALAEPMAVPLARRAVATGRASLRALYAATEYRPLWTANGRPTAQALAVAALLARVADRGLRPADYDAAALGSEAASLADATAPLDDPQRVARFDLSMSRAVLRLLARATAAASDPATTIAAAEPRYAGYAALREALARYRALAADSAVVAPLLPARPVRPGDALGSASALRRFLLALGDYRSAGDSAAVADSVRYTPDLVPAVEAFQRRHSLEPDGVIGRETARQLRIPLSQRVQQIELSLERWRWLPDVPPERYAVVNIPGFRLVVFAHDSLAAHPLLEMSVIVGQAAGRHGTPIFTGTMDEVVFRPFWDVPLSIARKELIPLIRRQPSYFDSEGFEIVRGAGDDAVAYAPTTANLDRVVDGTLRLRQRPGTINALGLVKFVFPNSHNVYLHGTPAQQLFARTRRDFSHGCIRIANPVGLAELVLGDQAGWDRGAIEAAMAGDSTVHVHVSDPITVFILYVTAVAPADGTVRFYPDLYHHDAALARALQRVDRVDE